MAGTAHMHVSMGLSRCMMSGARCAGRTSRGTLTEAACATAEAAALEVMLPAPEWGPSGVGCCPAPPPCLPCGVGASSAVAAASAGGAADASATSKHTTTSSTGAPAAKHGPRLVWSPREGPTLAGRFPVAPSDCFVAIGVSMQISKQRFCHHPETCPQLGAATSMLNSSTCGWQVTALLQCRPILSEVRHGVRTDARLRTQLQQWQRERCFGTPALTEDSSLPGIPAARRSMGTPASCARSCSLTWPVHCRACLSAQHTAQCRRAGKDIQWPCDVPLLLLQLLRLVPLSHSCRESGEARHGNETTEYLSSFQLPAVCAAAARTHGCCRAPVRRRAGIAVGQSQGVPAAAAQQSGCPGTGWRPAQRKIHDFRD